MADVFVRFKNPQVQKPIENALCWYDHINHKMLNFVGSRLVFSYKLDKKTNKYQMIPEVLHETRPSNQVEQKSLNNWYNNYLNYHNSGISISGQDDNGIVFEVPDEELDNVLYDLDRISFRFSVI